MATLKEHPQLKGKYRLAYKHPYLGYKSKVFRNFQDGNNELKKWEYIEMLAKTGQKYEHHLQALGQAITVGDVLMKYSKAKLSRMKNKGTKKRYENVNAKIIDVFGANQPIKTLRTDEVNGESGWERYKSEMHLRGRSNNGVNSDLNMARIFFTWALETDIITDIIIKKVDKYTDNELDTISFKEWTEDEIVTLFNHPELSEYQKDLIHIYTMLGVRAHEILGKNKRCPDKVFLWEHVDFDNNIIYISPKRTNQSLELQHRQKVYMPESVAIIFQKWRKYPMPLDFTYTKLRRDIYRINDITGIQFTCHDLRRLHSQIVERHTGDMRKVATSIGDKSIDVVRKHYAGVSIQTQRTIANDFKDGLNNIMNCNSL